MSTFTAFNGGSPKAHDNSVIHVATERAPSSNDDSQMSDVKTVRMRPSSARRDSWTSPRSERHSSYHSRPNQDGAEPLKRKRSDSAGDQPDSQHYPSPRTSLVDNLPAEPDPETAGNGHYTARSQEPERGRIAEPNVSPRPVSREKKERKPLPPSSDPTRTPAIREKRAEEATARSKDSSENAAAPSSDTEEKHSSAQAHSANARPDSILQHDPKKRKRNFSNRTKTGCLTCRKRKKKCDEEKPECTNCVRGGFVCAGYPPQRGASWHKPDSKSPAVPLESKDPTYVPPGAYGMPQPSSNYGSPTSYSNPTPPAKRESLPHYRGGALRIDPPQGRPVASEEDRQATSAQSRSHVASPDTKLSALPYTPASVFPTPISANTQATPFADRAAKDYHRGSSLHDYARPEAGLSQQQQQQQQSQPQPHQQPQQPQSSQLPQIKILHPPRHASPPPQPHSASVQVAQLALSHTHYSSRRSEKEEMISQRLYYPSDRELCLERERCSTACWRFNHLTGPAPMGVSPDERARLFLDILAPHEPVQMAPSEVSPITAVGRVGRDVDVETPFTCDYGYNVIIGNNVSIGRNCTLNDVCEIKIGDNCVFGPNVSIYTAMLPVDPKKRQGAQGPQTGRTVLIESDCWIGAGAMILPGRTIGKGSTVGAGSIVTKDVPPFTVVAGNPARVLRGVAS